jgi:hypothetical protein
VAASVPPSRDRLRRAPRRRRPPGATRTRYRAGGRLRRPEPDALGPTSLAMRAVRVLRRAVGRQAAGRSRREAGPLRTNPSSGARLLRPAATQGGVAALGGHGGAIAHPRRAGRRRAGRGGAAGGGGASRRCAAADRPGRCALRRRRRFRACGVGAAGHAGPRPRGAYVAGRDAGGVDAGDQAIQALGGEPAAGGVSGIIACSRGG